VNRLKIAIRRLAPLVLVAFAAGAIAAHADNGAPKPPAPRATVVLSSPPATPVPAVGKFIAACRPVKKAPAAATPPSQALLDAFAILRRERRPEDALPPEALKALQQRDLAPVSPDSARLLRTGPGGGQAWVVPVPDVTRGAFPFACAPKGKPAPREGLAVVAVKRAAPGGGGALNDLVRGRAPVSVDSCAGENGDMLGISGIVPNGVAAVFLTAPDGTAIRADVKDNGYEFLIPRPRTAGQRYVVWTGGDGTPHVQPVLAFGVVRGPVCKQLAARGLPPQVTPGFGFGSCAVAVPVAVRAPRPIPKGGRVIPVPPRAIWGACEAAPALLMPPAAPAPFPVPVPKSPPRKHR
jgi:hypothetical protein